MNSSIFHFFAELLQYRGYLAQDVNLEEYEKLPDSLIAVRSYGTFPDLVLRKGTSGGPHGGELIELKTAGSYTIPSFNSTPPSARKSLSSLSKKVLDELRENGEQFESDEVRDVYYLLVGRNNKAKPKPLTKIVLVYGGFFESVPLRDVLLTAGNEILAEASGNQKIDLNDVFASESAEEIKERFNTTRTVEGAGMKVRFRTMYEVSSSMNFMRRTRFPMIGDDTLSFVTSLDNLEQPPSVPLTEWAFASQEVRDLSASYYLGEAIDDVDSNLRKIVSIGVYQHPLLGRYFLAQADIG